MASGEMSEAEFVSFLNNCLRLGLRIQRQQLSPLRLHGLATCRRPHCRRQAELRRVPESLCVWIKDNGGMGSFYRSQHELMLVFRKGKGPHRNNIQLGQFGRNRTNVWQYPGIHSLSKQSDEGNSACPASHGEAGRHGCRCHPRLLRARRSGARRLPGLGNDSDGRRTCGTHLRAELRSTLIYVDVAVRRWQNLQRRSGRPLAITGKQFNEVAALNRRCSMSDAGRAHTKSVMANPPGEGSFQKGRSGNPKGPAEGFEESCHRSCCANVAERVRVNGLSRNPHCDQARGSDDANWKSNRCAGRTTCAARELFSIWSSGRKTQSIQTWHRSKPHEMDQRVIETISADAWTASPAETVSVNETTIEGGTASEQCIPQLYFRGISDVLLRNDLMSFVERCVL
jgi:hypothetical protein